MGCKHPNLDPTALSAKNALLPAVLRSVVRDMVEKETGGFQDGIPHLPLALSRFLGAILARILLEFLNGGFSKDHDEGLARV